MTVSSFLSFLAKDIQKNPQNAVSLNNELFQQVQSLVTNVAFDLDKSLLDEDE